MCCSLQAVQSFNTNTMAISNGIFLGDFPALQFFGKFEWKEKARKLEFDFDSISVLGLKINLPKGTSSYCLCYFALYVFSS